MRRLCVLGICCAFALPLLSQECPTPTKEDLKKEAVPFCLVAQKIQDALDQYNQTATEEPGGKANLALSTADFDFKVATSKNLGFSFSILVFKIGASRQVDTTEEVTYSYEVPKKQPGEFAPKWTPQDFSKELINAIAEASRNFQAVPSIGKAVKKSLTVNLSYGVKWDFTAGVTIPIQLVTVNPSGDRNSTQTQTVKLTFVDPATLKP